jgi:photosystem II stability/assembly factor-like uncharacterized protein
MNKQSLDDRLRQYLTRGADQATPPDLEDRLLARSPSHPPTRQLMAGALGATALVILGAAVVLGIHLGRSSVRSPVTPATPLASPAPTAIQAGIVFDSIDMKTTSSGWALADTTSTDGSAIQSRLILRTTDGGRRWQRVSPPGSWKPVSAWFLNESQAWAASVSQGHQVSVMRTTDGGSHWQEATVPDQQALGPTFLDFVDATHGWLFVSHGAAAGSEGGAVYQTVDGGLNWRQVAVTSTSDAPGQLPFGGDKNGLIFVNASAGWLTASSAGPAPLFYVTHDGGHTWHPQGLTVPSGVELAGAGISAPRFFSATDGEFEVDANRTVVYTTRDGGATWTGRLAPALGTAFFLDASTGWLVSHDGTVAYTTTDGGQSWLLHNQTRQLNELIALEFVNRTRGFAILGPDASHAVLTTSDGGQTWSPLNPSVT